MKIDKAYFEKHIENYKKKGNRTEQEITNYIFLLLIELCNNYNYDFNDVFLVLYIIDIYADILLCFIENKDFSLEFIDDDIVLKFKK